VPEIGRLTSFKERSAMIGHSILLLVPQGLEEEAERLMKEVEAIGEK